MSILLSANQAQAQGGIEMGLSAAVQFGEQVTFTARLVSPVQIQKASILINDSTQDITYIEPVIFNDQGISEYRFDTRQNSLRPFTTILWRYELTLADGSTVQSAMGSIRYDDDRFAWQTLEADALRIHWYGGDGQFGVAALNAGQAGLNSIRGLFAPDLSQPVDVFIYANESDLRGTLYGAESWVAGHADSAAGVVMVTIEPGANQNIMMEQRIPHELMHVMFFRQITGDYKNVPVWLREGMSMLAEVYPNPDYDSILKDAAARNALIPIRDLCAPFSPRIDSAFLAYAESRSFTNYLRGQYGSDGLLTLANIHANGVDCERGAERAFGVPLAKLERDWRVTVLGESNLMSALGNFVPYLVLLCLVVLFPLIGVIGSMKKKGNGHGR
ncbi:MAG TPA: peptidase MA family metallohydrolase [Anaerolineales bacterium]|nr:peptidase MA family metallohydrolase [Anaerolineales bacterium]